jgi:DNA polymerase elongation subunit (family B)
LGFQECILRGSGSALDALLIAEYLSLGRALPLPEASRPYAWALSSMEAAGVFRGVRHCDVRSLYPSLLLMFNESPCRDEAGVFLKLLAELRKFRLAAKDRAKSLPDGPEKQQQEALQSSFKILINSFYGYLGFAQGTFNDYTLAEKVTAAGRELLGKLVGVLEKHGAEVIEMDTDGIYFKQPDCDREQFDAALNEILPPGIELEFDAEYPAMYSYKAKNYALLHQDGGISLTGAALKSRALELFQRKFILDVVRGRLTGDEESIRQAYRKYHDAISRRTIPVEELAKSEVLSDSPENYRKKLASGSARRSAAYELALASGKKFRAGDRIKFYVTGDKAKLPVVGNSCLIENMPETRDENTAYYLAKLDALASAFGVGIN